MPHYITVATCSLNQWALDFEGNRDRILESISVAKAKGATLRVGPELEITGYGCLDHFLENDVYLHSWEMYAQILANKATHGILLDIGMPIIHKNRRFNCRVISYDGRILLIRPKLFLANDGNYREMRFFTPWLKPRYVEQYVLPRIIQKLTLQTTVDFGDAVISTLDTVVGAETCEELFTPHAPNIDMSLDGVEIITNSSGSHHELRKLNTRMELITEATKKGGGIYLYSNQKGCDGDRLYYDGCSLIVVNGKVLAQGKQFSLLDVEVITATIDLEDVRAYRALVSHGLQSRGSPVYERVHVPIELSPDALNFDLKVQPTTERAIHYFRPEEEIAYGPACWLWDYIRRCHGAGYFLPLSGGIDSCATAVIVHSMCKMVVDACAKGEKQPIKDARAVAGYPTDSDWVPQTPQEFANKIFHTCYMGTKNSSAETRSRAKELAKKIGSYHVDLNMDSIVSSIVSVFEVATGKKPIYKVFGGTNVENLALQNIQARMRMVLAYLFAQLLPWTRGRNAGGLLVLGSANVDEQLRGYLTKYDCSSADINPIGSISKVDLIRFIKWAEVNFEMPILRQFVDATPTAELEPITDTHVQSDEADMGFTYEELGTLGRLRKIDKCGPYSMFVKLLHQWNGKKTPRETADKVEKFFFYYSINRHKQTVSTPSYHAEQYSPDDHRFDLRPFLIDPRFPWARHKIDQVLEKLETHEELDTMTVD